MEEGGRGKTPRSTCVSTLCLRCGPRTPNSQQNAAGVAPSPTAGGRLNCSPPARTAAPNDHACAWLQRYFSYVARSYPDPWIRTRAPCGEVFSCVGESTIMSNILGITAVAATISIAAATGGVHGGDYSAIAQADQSARSVRGWAQASQLSQTAEPSMPAVQLGQESPPLGTPAPPVGNSLLNPHSGTPAVVLDDQQVSAILGKSVRSNAG